MTGTVVNPKEAPHILQQIVDTTIDNNDLWELSQADSRRNMWSYLEEFFDLEEAQELFALTDQVVKDLEDHQ